MSLSQFINKYSINMKTLLIKITRKTLRIPFYIKKRFYTIWNKFLFNIYNIDYKTGLNVYGHLYMRIRPNTSIKIGKNFNFTSGIGINPLSRNKKGFIFVAENGILNIGNNVGISSSCLWIKEKVIIGNNVFIGADCIIMDTDAHNLDYQVRRDQQVNEKGLTKDVLTATSSPITIGDDVLIGTRCIILKGVKIGNRTIIGSGSVVTKSIPDDCIAAGNPCKIIRYTNNNPNLI